jgi:hypothetical protein
LLLPEVSPHSLPDFDVLAELWSSKRGSAPDAEHLDEGAVTTAGLAAALERGDAAGITRTASLLLTTLSVSFSGSWFSMSGASSLLKSLSVSPSPMSLFLGVIELGCHSCKPGAGVLDLSTGSKTALSGRRQYRSRQPVMLKNC